MAIDTAAKRRNAAQVGAPLPVSVLPSGSITAAVRGQISWSYQAAGSGPPPPPPDPPVPWLVPGPTHADFFQIHDYPAFF